ncbi:MAG TPA: cupin domain-containing protein, partial [Pilimelia sp.]|nr:cupin domain-containing protein [Pilimelia sp.]
TLLRAINFPEAARHLAFEVFSRSFFADPRQLSAAEMVLMFHIYFLGSAEGLLFDVPDAPFPAALWEPLAGYLRRHGAEIRTVLSPGTVGATAGFLGTAVLAPGEVIREHWHPYSEEFLYCVRGEVVLRLSGREQVLRADHGVLVPIGVRHRVANHSDSEAFLVFQLSPLAPHPAVGHISTEPPPDPHAARALTPGAAGHPRGGS